MHTQTQTTFSKQKFLNSLVVNILSIETPENQAETKIEKIISLYQYLLNSDMGWYHKNRFLAKYPEFNQPELEACLQLDFVTRRKLVDNSYRHLALKSNVNLDDLVMLRTSLLHWDYLVVSQK